MYKPRVYGWIIFFSLKVTHWKAFVRTKEIVLELKWKISERENTLIPQFAINIMLCHYVRAWWKSQPDVDRQPLESLSLVNILRFSSGWRRPDWGFQVVNVTGRLWTLIFSNCRRPGRRSTSDVDHRRCRHLFLLTFSSRPYVLHNLI